MEPSEPSSSNCPLHQDDVIAVLCHRQARDEVNPYLLPLLSRQIMLLQLSSIGSGAGLVSLAESVAAHKLPHAIVQGRPLE